MAKILGKDEATYSKERDGFLRDLQHFHETRGTPMKRPPVIGGREVDLYLLYTLVTSKGGWLRVNSKNTWSEILTELNVPRGCINASVALKQIYLRYLDRWEKVHFLHEEGDRASDDDEESRHKRWSARTLHSVPHTYNYNQHNVNDTNREFNHLATDLYKASDYDRLALSLLSPLPNEQDFAINVCTLLSNDGKHSLKFQKHPRIINYLLGHAGVFNHGSLRETFTKCYSNIRKKPIHNFWKDVVVSSEYLDLTNESNYKSNRDAEDVVCDTLVVKDVIDPTILPSETPMDTNDSGSRVPNDSDCVINLSDSESEDDSLPKDNGCDNKKLTLDDPSDDDLFNLKRSLGTQDYVGQRILQIATILRNLSFIEDNAQILVQNTSFIRFVLLCCTSRWNILKNLGMDMLGNIASEFVVKDLQYDLLASNLLKIVTKGLLDPDRASCLSSLEVLNKLSQNEKNEDVLLRSLEANVYKYVCSFLTIHDVMLLIYTLECLYSLSSLGERSCHLIVKNHGVIDTLVSLVTVEGKSYGPKACIGMKLVETLPSGTSSTQNQNNNPQQTNASTSTSTVQTTAMSSVSTPTVTSTTVSRVTPPSTPLRPPTAIAPQRLLAMTPSPAAPSATICTTASVTYVHTPPTPQVSSPVQQLQTAASTAMTPQQLIQQQHAHQQAIHENEQFALSWLRAHYEPCLDGTRIDHQELYRQYLTHCSKIGRRGVIAPLHFPRCVRSVFGGTVGPNPMKPANPNDPQYYDGIKAMSHPHLSQALLNSSTATSTVTTDTMSSVPNAVKDGSMTTGQASSTSLIKSLLATKVNDCMSTVSMRTATDCQNVAQVAARQQRLLAQSGNNQSTPDNQQKTAFKDTPKFARINGARQLFNDNEIGDPSVSSTTQFTNLLKGKKEPPQPPPPPLAPLSNNVKGKTQKILDNDDSDSLGNHSVASSSGIGTVGIGGISSTEDGDNSLTCFEGLLNGIPSLENPLNEDSNSKDSVKIISNEISMHKPLKLADLLEKKFEKSPPLLNGVLGKDSSGESMDLVENHIEKVLRENENKPDILKSEDSVEIVTTSLKRSASDEIMEVEAKRPLLSSNVNGSSSVNSPDPDSVSSSNGDETSATVSTAAAKLFADIAADILEDEDEEQLLQEAQAPPQMIESQGQIQIPSQSPIQQIIVDNNQVLLTQPRQIIVSQAQIGSGNSVVMNTGTPMKTQSGQTVIVQNSASGQRPMMMQQANTGQFMLTSGLQGQMQLVASTHQPGQYVLQTGGPQGTYVVAQPQTAVVHGQPQTVLVAQTAQQQGSPAKTIIILQQQPPPSQATHHQKVVVTPQGQQVVVTQVPRPVAQTSSVSNNPVPVSKVMKSIASTNVTQMLTTNGVPERKKEEARSRMKIVRDITTPYVCEWGDCSVETKFKSANEVYLHACATHCPTGNEEVICLWDRCDNLKRKRYSLMTHLNDKHCNTEAMKQALIRRKQAAHGVKVEPTPPPSSSNHPGYAPDAALHAIKRHALEFVNPKELQDDNEGPVTKSIRLTASLILRNLVIYSSHCKRYLKSYESHLANVALSNVESSRTIAQVLYDMNDGSTHR